MGPNERPDLPGIRDWDLELTVDDVRRGVGAAPGLPPPAMAALAVEALAAGRPLLSPAALIRRDRIERRSAAEVRLAGGGALSGRRIARELRNAQEACLVLCTIGSLLEERAAALISANPALAVLLDAVGTAAVGALAAAICDRLRRSPEVGGLPTTAPLSPGMVDWPVDPGQREVLAILGGASIGVEMTPSLQLTPLKSLTFVVGLGPSLDDRGGPCRCCPLHRTCRHRPAEVGPFALPSTAREGGQRAPGKSPAPGGRTP